MPHRHLEGAALRHSVRAHSDEVRAGRQVETVRHGSGLKLAHKATRGVEHKHRTQAIVGRGGGSDHAPL